MSTIFDILIDVWGISVIMYELLCGTRAYQLDYLTNTIEIFTSVIQIVSLF